MDSKEQTAVVCGAGRFIGGHRVRGLLANKINIKVTRAVAVKPFRELCQVIEGLENLSLDLKDRANCVAVADGAELIFQRAPDNIVEDIVEEIAGIKLKRTYNLNAPEGVSGRNTDNTLILKKLGWEPSTHRRDGLEKTYCWIENEMAIGSGGR